MVKSLRPFAALAALVLVSTPLVAAAPALTPPGEAILAEARALVEAMKANERGPYTRLRWYCNDGTVHPPTPYACAERGGGRQHAEFSPERQRLAALGWSVGTIYAALGWEELLDAGRRNDRMRQLPLESYLVAVDDGWVLRRARGYRGRVQVEDEEAAGRELLVKALGRQGDWLDDNFLLVRELARIVPHHGGSDRTRSIRILSQELAAEDPGFERLRIKIHTTPGPEDAASVAAWIVQARARSAPAARVAKAEKLRAELEALYGTQGVWRREARAALAKTAAWPDVAAAVDLQAPAPAAERLGAFSAALARARRRVVAPAAGGSAGALSLALLDLSLALEREATKAAFEELARRDLKRSDLLRLAGDLARAAYGAGLLSPGELAALERALAPVTGVTAAGGTDFVAAVRALRRVGPWALATVRYTFGGALVRYAALAPEAGRFPDEVLRGSALLPLAEVTTRLSADSDHLSGISHRLFGETHGGMLGLNPGIAVGPLRLFPPDWAGEGVEREQIVVLPRTVAELDPVAGILSLGEGNLLSHVQLLARNLGIPNATLAPSVARALEGRDATRVLLAVGTDGSIVLEAESDLPAATRELLAAPTLTPAAGARIEAPPPDLSVRRLLPLAELEASLSGRVVGPKAANLGELARLFPGRVEQAIAIPFGVFFAHLSGGPDAPKARLDRVFAEHRAGRVSEDELLAEVARIRAAIAATRLSDDFRQDLRREMERRFGPPGSYGVFIRSDTNVEDLPGFTGAGLNQTLPHVTDFDRVAEGIATVWSSPLAPRALAWRSMILARPEEVYASVLLMKSVPADKSGVLITTDLVGRRDGLTVATAWGVGGAVDGEAAETLVLGPDGGETLVGEAKAPYHRQLEPSGGVAWVPAPAGAVLTADEKRILRELAAEVAAKRRPVTGRGGQPLPWDIEFGFVDGKLALFQIRPLVERGQQRADALIDTLVPPRPAMPAEISLDVAAPAP